MSEKKMFFGLSDGILGLEFEGTEEELREDFDKKVANFVADLEKQIETLEEDKKKIVRPACFDKLSKERQVAIDCDMQAQIANKDAEIAAAKKQIDKAKNMSISDVTYFVLTPIKL